MVVITDRPPSRFRAIMLGAVGSLQLGLGKLTRNPNTIIAGQAKKVSAKTEKDLANLNTASKLSSASTNIASNHAAGGRRS